MMIDKVKEIIAERMDMSADEIAPDAALQDVMEDELDMVDILMELEDVYNISLPDELLEEIHTVRELADYIASQI